MKSVIYARYSTDKQSESSIDDQVRLCKVRVEFEGWQLASIYSDEGVSGSTPVARRAGGVKLLSDAMANKFDALVIEGLDRLSRDLVEQETIVRRLEHRGIRILGLSDGYDSEQSGRQLVRGMRGLINEMYLEDLKKKTHRGMSGQVARGFAAGAAPFGYQNVKTEQGSNIEVNPEAAQWVSWIYEEFAGGRSCKSIVCELNEKKVKSPRGSSWGVSGLYGSPAKGSGLLNNELYRGRHIWNRSQWIKDPDTGKRVRIERPETEWCVNEREDLRIVSDDLWGRVRSRCNETSQKKSGRRKGARLRSLLSGLMHCGKCGAPLVVVSSHSYGCSNRMNRGPSVCEGINVNRKEIEKKLLAEIQEVLLCDEMIEYAYTETMKALSDFQSGEGQSRKELVKKVEQLEKEIERYIEAIGVVGISDSIAKKLKAAETEKVRIEREICNEPKVIEFPKLSDIKKQYKLKVIDLQQSLKEDVQEARTCLKDLLGNVEINNKGENIYADMQTNPASLSETGSVCNLVAGAGFEPTTFGL